MDMSRQIDSIHTKSQLPLRVFATLMLLALIAATPLAALALTSQSVSVSAESGSVSASGGETSVGESSVSVELRQNGEVVESYSERGTGQIEYTTTVESEGADPSVSAHASAQTAAPENSETTDTAHTVSETARRNELAAIIARLETLIALYAKLLSS